MGTKGTANGERVLDSGLISFEMVDSESDNIAGTFVIDKDAVEERTDSLGTKTSAMVKG